MFPENTGTPAIVPDKVAPLIAGDVSVLLVRVCVPVSVTRLVNNVPLSMAVSKVAPVLFASSTSPVVDAPEPTILPPPLGVAHVPSPRQKVVPDAPVPEFKLATGKLPE
jgi:hypothetical protein